MRCFLASLLGCSGLIFTACHRLDETEEKVVGTWEYTGFDSRSRIVFRRDHIMVVLIPVDGDDFNARHWTPASWGKWQMEGNTIIVNNQRFFGLDGERSTGEVTRLPFREFYENRLVSDDAVTWNRLSAAKQLCAKLLLLFYTLACCAAIASLIVVARGAIVWKSVIVAAVAAIGMLSLSMLAVLGELGETGSWVISPMFMKWLQVLNEFVKVGLVIILMVATARLTYQALTRSTEARVAIQTLPKNSKR